MSFVCECVCDGVCLLVCFILFVCVLPGGMRIILVFKGKNELYSLMNQIQNHRIFGFSH